MDQLKKFWTAITTTPDHTKEFSPKDISENRFISAISYLSILFLIPLFCRKNSKFARYHASQGLTLFALQAVLAFLSGILSILPFIGGVCFVICEIGIAFTVALSVIGILSTCMGQAKELPVIGGIRFLK